MSRYRSYTFQNINKWSTDLNAKHKTIEKLERIGENIGELGLGNILRFNAKGIVHGRKN